jgi:DNA-binding protein H-NS
LRNGEVTVEQLKQLVELQTQIVKQAQQIEHARKRRHGVRQKLAGGPRRLLRFISQLW